MTAARSALPAERAFLVGLDQPRISRHIGGKNGRKPTFDAFALPGTHRGSLLLRTILLQPSHSRQARPRRLNPSGLLDARSSSGNGAANHVDRVDDFDLVGRSVVPSCYADLSPYSADLIPCSIA
jgi:hypothetical protein